MITTSLCALLGIKHPILNASMAESATGELAAAVSNAGGFGMIGGSTSSGSSWLREQIQAARSRTTRPFGVGFISSFPNTDELVQVALDERVTAINHSFADPTTFVAPAHAVDINVFAQVQTLAQAITAAEAGVDVIIAQGGEAGGHGGSLGTFALLPAIIDAVGGIPVVAAGGIADGRGLAAALLLGAQGAWMGTRFVASREWGGPPWKQDAILAASADDTLRTTVYDRIYDNRFPEGIAGRVLRNAYAETWQGRDAEIVSQRARFQDDLAAAEQRADTSMAQISAGVSAGLITSAPSAGEIVRSIVQEAEDLLRARPQELLR
jgi:nitronate monooxygenase